MSWQTGGMEAEELRRSKDRASLRGAQEQARDRKQLDAIERNRKMEGKEKRAMSNLESYFQQRNDKCFAWPEHEEKGCQS